MSDDKRRELLDVLAVGDGQQWFHMTEDQWQIAETMYGGQADALLGSSWLAERDARMRAEAKAEFARFLQSIADNVRGQRAPA